MTIKEFMTDEHRKCDVMLTEVENAVEGGSFDTAIALNEDFESLTLKHFDKEEKYLFPRISKKMTETGEHSKADENFNVIDVLEDDHVKSIQLAAVASNMFVLFSRISDERSRYTILDIALNPPHYKYEQQASLLPQHALTIVF